MLEVNFENFVKLLGDEAFRKKHGKYNEIERCLKFIENGSRIIIWPFANMGQMVYENLRNVYNNEIIAVDKDAVNIKYDGIKVYSIDDIERQDEDVLILATLNNAEIISDEATRRGFKNILMNNTLLSRDVFSNVMFNDNYHITLLNELEKSLLSNQENYFKMYFNLSDEKSRIYFLSNMFYWLTGDIEYLRIKEDHATYFNEMVLDNPKFSEGAIIDGGGYIGDTLEDFLSLSKDFHSYYLFEPYKKAIDSAKAVSSDERIFFIDKGLWSENKTLSFNIREEDPEGNRLSTNGNVNVEVVSVDSCVDEKVGLIKLDVEGAELEALKGAEDAIIRDRPILIICIYHKPDDYIEIFNYIIKIYYGAQFYIRKIGTFWYDTILYVLPR